MKKRLSERGLALIAYYEASTSLESYDGHVWYPGGTAEIPAKYLKVYADPIATDPVPTVGFGTTSYDIKGLKVGQEYSQADVIKMFETTIGTYEKAVNKHVTVKLNQNEFDALVSFVYNVGIGAFKKSTLLRLLNRGQRVLATDQFHRWDKAGGKEHEGLRRRRSSEAILFATPVSVPRADITESRTVRAAGALGVVGTVTALAPAIGPLEQFASFIEGHVWVAGVVAIAVAGYVIAVRFDDWQKGRR